jgi:[ribosomal protein S18]-alanine N-acetyltransferase
MQPKSSPIIRAMAASDVDSLQAIARESAEAPHWALADYQQILFSDRTAPFYRFASVAQTGMTLGATLGGFAVASILRIEELATLESIVVRPSFRRQGIGAALLASLIRSASEAGARIMHLEVRASNATAIAFYLRQGFQQSGRRRAYYSAPIEDGLLFKVEVPEMEVPLPRVSY